MHLSNNRAVLMLSVACDANNANDFMFSLRQILKADNCNEIMPSFIAEAAMVLFTTIDTDKIVPCGRRFTRVLSMLDNWRLMPTAMWQTTFKEYAQLVMTLAEESKLKGIEVNNNAEGALLCLNSMLDVIEGKLGRIN